MKVPDAPAHLDQEKARNRSIRDEVVREAINKVEQTGIVF